MSDNNTIVIIGRGNVAYHLGQLFRERGKTVYYALSRGEEKTDEMLLLSEIPTNALMYLISVKDAAYEELISQLNDKLEGIVVHTSGTLPLSILGKFKKKGVFYPFQTFRKEISLWEKDFAILVESDDSFVAEQLLSLGKELTENAIQVNEETRKKTHLAGVIASNFVNYLLHLSYEILAEEKIEIPKLLLPLVLQTVKRIKIDDPIKFQTGPAARNDRNILDMHLKMLENKPKLKEIYLFLTNQLLSAYDFEKLSEQVKTDNNIHF